MMSRRQARKLVDWTKETPLRLQHTHDASFWSKGKLTRAEEVPVPMEVVEAELKRHADSPPESAEALLHDKVQLHNKGMEIDPPEGIVGETVTQSSETLQSTEDNTPFEVDRHFF